MESQREDKIKNSTERPPVVVVMGHIDHGKSTLLDYIRKTNVVDIEAGGITQHISAYEVVHKDEHGKDKRITFLDTPGHEAFSKMRERGAHIADIAILVVSAEDGVKPQTIEAAKTILASNTPYIVAINKIDKPGANVEKTKMELAENEIYLEGYGGKIPFAEISAKIGTGVDNLLSLILILAELENFTGNPDAPASGLVIEAHMDPKRGVAATLIIKDGTIKKGMIVATESASCSTRMLENFKGEMINEATFSSPIRLVGFDKIPRVGATFHTFANKKDAEAYISKNKNGALTEKPSQKNDDDKKIIPIVLKADVSGSIEAIEKEIGKIKPKGEIESAKFKIVNKGAGQISEGDIKAASDDAIVIGFNTKADRSAMELAEKRGIPINYFNIIYKMTEWLEVELENRRPRVETIETTGTAKILKSFSRTKERQIVGGKVITGNITDGATVKIIRRENEIGKGKIVGLQKGKAKTGTVEEGAEFGTMIESKIELAPGDVIESFAVVQK